MLARARRELADEVGVPAVAELALEPPFERGEAQLLEPCDLALRERLEGKIGERRAAPQRQRLVVAFLSEQPLEPVQVELVVVDAERVAGRPRLQAIIVEQPTEAGDVAMQRGQRRRRRGLAPQRVDEDILRDDLVRAQQQHPEQRALMAAAESDDAAVLRHLQRAQDPEVDRSLLLRPTLQRQRPISDSLPALWIVACVHDKEQIAMKILFTIAALTFGLALVAAPAHASDRTIVFEVKPVDRAVSCAGDDQFGLAFDMVAPGGATLGAGRELRPLDGRVPAVQAVLPSDRRRHLHARVRERFRDRADDAARAAAE